MDLMDYRRKIIANSPHLMSASGAVATFSDGADLPLESLVVDIEPVQSGTGDPSPDNVRPISGWDAVNVTLSGVNKLPPMVDGTYTGNGLTAVVKDGVATLSGTSTASGNALTIPLAEEYTVTQGYLHLCNSVANASFAPSLESENISATSVAWACSPVNRVGAIPSNRIGQKWNRVMVWIGSGVTISGTYAPMVCADNTVRQYEPYNGVDVSVDLGQTVYGGTLNPLTGVLTVDRAIADLGTLDWRMSGSGNTAFHYANTSALGVATNISTTLNYICSNYSIVAVSSGGTATGMAFTSANQLRIRDATYASASDFKAAMDGVTLCYELATPYTVQLTPHQIRSLYGNNTIFADTGNVALEYWAHP